MTIFQLIHQEIRELMVREWTVNIRLIYWEVNQTVNFLANFAMNLLVYLNILQDIPSGPYSIIVRDSIGITELLCNILG